MMSQHVVVRWALLVVLSCWAAGAQAQTVEGFITGFEPSGPTEVTYPVGYTTGPVLGQDLWQGGSRGPRVQTAAEIAAELEAAGLNPANPVHSGDQALLVAKVDDVTETSATGGGYLVRNVFLNPIVSTDVIAEWWARPLTSGLGADPSGTPAGNGKTIGERQGNTFVGIMDESENRAAAVRFGVDTVGSDPYTNVVERHIDFGSASAGSNVWVKSGLLWEADAWYHFKLDLDFVAKTYDFYVNGVKANTEPIRFYNEAATDATRFFVSRGTNQAGQIIDDVSVVAQPPAGPGDFDADGDVDGNDFLVWQRNTSVGSLDAWKANFGGASIAPVPEPTAAGLAWTAMALGIAARRWRNRCTN
ncbi:MAG: hypothetical protein DCC67_13590 [Planctomycetota bacterium]|nr:MAG: hypothetical protein DCC67_13590 [Planctomycetota bacterium]